MKSVRLLWFSIIFTSILLIGFLGCNGGSSSSSDDSNTNNPKDENTTEQTTLYDDYKTLSDFTKATYTAKLKFMSVMSNGFEASYGEVEPEAGDVADYVDSHTRVLESLEDVTAAVERINAAKKEPRADFAPASQVMFLNAASSDRSVMAGDDNTGGKTEGSSLIAAWDFLVNGLWGSAARSRERVINTLDQLSEEGRREAYEYAKTARGIMNRDDVEDNAEDFWESLKQGKYDNQCAVLYNDLTAPSAIADDIEFADVAERNSATGRPDYDAVLEEGTDLIKKGKNFNPAIDGDVLKGELENLAEKEMQQEAKKFQEHTEEHHYGDTDNAAESFAESVENAAKSGAFDPDSVKDLSDATKKAVDAIVPADDDAPPPDQGLLTVSDDSGQTEDGTIVIAEGEDAGGNPSVYISDMIGDITITLPEGFWEVTAAGVNSVADSISAEVQAGLETLATVDTSEEQPADPAMEISTSLSDEDADSITYQVTATVSGVTGVTDVTLSLQNAQTWDNTTKSLSADGTITWSVTVLENEGVVTVKRSDTNESRSVTLQGKTTNADSGMEISKTITDPDIDNITYRVTVTLSGVTGPTNVSLSLQNVLIDDDTTKTLSADGTVTWRVAVLENNGVITVTRSDTNESQSLTLQGTSYFDAIYEGEAEENYEGEDCFCWDFSVYTVFLKGSSLSGDITGTVSGNQITGYETDYGESDYHKNLFTGVIEGNVMSGTYVSADGCCRGTFRLTKQ